MTDAMQQYDIRERDAVRADLEREGREELAAELAAERFGPLPQRDPGTAGDRTRAIAGIHALADWFATHSSVPVPWYVTANVGLPMDELAELAHVLGQPVYAEGRQFNYVISDKINITFSTRTPDNGGPL